MKVKELIERLKEFPDDMEVLTKKYEVFGNVGRVNSVKHDEYASLGTAHPCALITDEYEENDE